MDSFIETMLIEEAEYRLKTRLSWYESQRAEQTGQTIIFYLNEETIGDLSTLGEALRQRGATAEPGELRCEMRMDNAAKNMERLKVRLLGMTHKALLNIPAPHAAVLLRRISELEAEEQGEIAALVAGNPTTQP
jgi:hypothetical protein